MLVCYCKEEVLGWGGLGFEEGRRGKIWGFVNVCVC